MPVPRITFTSGLDSVTLQSPSPDIPSPITVPAASNRTPGGLLCQYRVGQPYWESNLHIDNMPSAKKELLEAFFRAHWTDTITYTDESGTTFTVKFMDRVLPLVKQFKNCWAVDLRLDFSAALG